MAFIRSKNHGQRKYYYRVENKRIDGKVRQRVIQYLGTTRPGDTTPHPKLAEGQSVKVTPQPMATGSQTFTPEATRDILNQPGLYRFYDKSGTLIYVGISSTLGDRLRRWHGEPTANPDNSTWAVRPDVQREISYFSYQYTSSIQEANDMERTLINRYEPDLNHTAGGGWHENPGSG